MLLSDLMDGNGAIPPDAATPAIDITGLTADSRKVAPGFLFAALAGSEANGEDFIDQALARGAAAVLAAPGLPARGHGPDAGAAQGVPFLTDLNPRRRLALMAARFYPRQPKVIAAITGTNGKTSAVSFSRQIWRRLGRQAASLGTAGITGPGTTRPTSQTTPDPVTLHHMIDELAGQGVTHLALEASSHGLDQHRLDGVRISAGGFTNLTRDHLDYHATFEDYLRAKLRLFGELLAPGSPVVLNIDDAFFSDVEALCKGRGQRILSVGSGNADLCLKARENSSEGQTLRLEYEGRSHTVALPLIGDFQAANALMAAGLALAVGEQPDPVFEALGHLRGARGRLQMAARLDNGAPVYVDYAHTPDALDNLLRALRPYTVGKLVLVFGCGGDRDRGKRPEMGAIATKLADRVIITDDNPRHEDPASIRRQIIQAAPGATEIGDRREAIREAVGGLAPEDVVVVAGKGHEQGQIAGGVFNPFDDVREAVAAVAALDGGQSHVA